MNKFIKGVSRWRKPRWVKGTMYCVNCSIADMLNEEANEVTFYGKEACEKIRQSARDTHAECEDPEHCTCKHIIGLILSPEDVARLKAQDNYEVPDYGTR